MPGPLGESIITLVSGPWDRMVYYASDWKDTQRSAENMGRTADEFCGGPLDYGQESPGSTRWIWTAGAPLAEEQASTCRRGLCVASPGPACRRGLAPRRHAGGGFTRRWLRAGD